MDEHQVRNLVKGWHQRSRIEGDLTTKLVFLWFCFNAWLAFESNEDTDREMINWLKDPGAAGSQLRSSFKLALGSSVFLGHRDSRRDRGASDPLAAQRLTQIISLAFDWPQPRTYPQFQQEVEQLVGSAIVLVLKYKSRYWFSGGKQTDKYFFSFNGTLVQQLRVADYRSVEGLLPERYRVDRQGYRSFLQT